MGKLNPGSCVALKAYIDSARKLGIYGGEDGWYSNNWVTTTLRNPMSMWFCELRSHGKAAMVPFQSPFLEFAKAYVRHQQNRKERGSIQDDMMALRFLYAALMEIQGEPDVLRLDGAVQESVRVKIAARYKKPDLRYRIGIKILLLYGQLRDHQILPALPHWQPPWSSPRQKNLSMDPESVEWRKAKTPDDQKLAAVLVAFEMAETEKDQYWSSLALLLAFASSRGGELIELSVHSLIDEHYADEYGHTRRRVGLRWFSEKGFGGNVKWVPRLPGSNRDEAQETELMDMVVRAFQRLVQLSEPAREAAKLAYDTNGIVYPIKLFSPELTDCPQDRVLSDLETAQIMGRVACLNRKGTNIPYHLRKPNYFSWHWPCVAHGNPTYQEIAQVDFENFSSKLLNWPFTSNSERVKVWECLVLYQWNQFNERNKFTVYPNSYCLPTTTQMGAQLGGRWVKGKKHSLSMFDRLGLTMEDGSSIQLTTHDFRRWHGTRGRALAHFGLSEHRLRMLAGRKDVRQNDAYDFNTPEQKVVQYRQIIARSGDNLLHHERLAIGLPIYRHELLGRQLGEHEVAQATQIGEFGGCTHSLSEPPCMKGGDCLTCSEKKYIKGIPGCLNRLREAAAHHKAQFNALDSWQKKRDQFGVDQWMTFHAIRYAIAETLVQQLEDPEVPEGSVLGVDAHFDPSPLKVNLMAKGIEVPEKSQDPIVAEINDLLGFADDA